MARLPKGSEEARQRMAHLRSLRKKKIGGSIEPVTPMNVPEESEITSKGSKRTEFAHKTNMNYFEYYDFFSR
jgi:hypothetical protein